MKKRLFPKISFGFLLLLYSSCTCYNVKIDYLQERFTKIDSNQFVNIKIQGIYGESYSYLANPIDYISCTDKQNRTINIENSPSTELKIVRKNNKKSVFYLDRIYIKDSILYGYDSRLYPKLQTVKLNDIKKIQCFEGKGIFVQPKK